LVNCTAYNSQYGMYISASNSTNITNSHLFNNGYDFYVSTDATERTVYLSNVSFDNPAGNYENYTILSINDKLEANTAYRINWTSNSSALPEDRFSFRQKFVNITSASGSVSIDSITWHWLDSEVTGNYNESMFELWEYNSSGWSRLNYTPNIFTNTLGLTNMNPASIYGILQQNFSGCFYADRENTTYQLAGNLQGNKSDTACITINATNVTINCAGYSIRGTDPGPTKAIMADHVQYITVENCTGYNYSYGFYSDQMFYSSITNNTFYNNSNAGMYVYASNDNNFTNNRIYNNSGYGIYLYQSDSNIINNSEIYNNNIAGIYIYTWSAYNTIMNVNIVNNSIGIGLQNVYSNNITDSNIINSSSNGIIAIISTPLYISNN